MKFYKKILSLLTIKLFVLSAFCADFNASELRETLKETSEVAEKTAKLKTDFGAEKFALETQEKLLLSLQEKLKSEIKNQKSEILQKEKDSKIVQKHLSDFSELEAKISATNAEAFTCLNLKKDESKNAFKNAKEIISYLKQSLQDSKTLRIEIKNKERILCIGNVAKISEKSSANAKKACDMLEGKIPFDYISLELKGKGL